VRPGTIECAWYQETYYWPNRLRLFDEVDDLLPSGRGDEWVSYLLFGQPQIQIPFWTLFAFLSILPLGWVVRRLTVDEGSGLCEACSYDLTGNTSGICPECGTALEGKSKVAA
jgi:hypothetical protein